MIFFFKTSLLVVLCFVTSVLYAQQPVTITEGHRNSYPSIKDKFTYSALGGEANATSIEVNNAKNVVSNFNITISPNGIDVSGNSISKADLLTGKKMRSWSKNMQSLALAAQATTPDVEAQNDLIKLAKHLLNQCGVNGCDGTGISGRNYTFYQEIWKGWLCAMPLFQAYDMSVSGSELAFEALSFIKRVYNYEAIYEQPFNVNDLSYATGDFIYTNTRFIFCMAAYNSTVDEQIADYIRIRRLYENYAKPRDGGIHYGSGIWLDGTFMHHGSAHSSYQYQLRQWIDDMDKMKGTAFEISLEAYNNIAKGVYALYLECIDGKALASSLGGRNPINSIRNWMLAPSYFIKLIKMGGSVKGGQQFDPDMAAKYNYLTNTHRFDIAPENLDGFHQMNYSGMGLYRGKNNSNRWVATMRGLTNKNWGAEFSNKSNTFGRYQSQGVLEIFYANPTDVIESSGYPKNSIEWDWNMIPGTTTVHHSPNPWYNIQVINSSSFSFQKNNFVGSLSNGLSGIFAMDYEEDPKNGGWGKSYNVIDNLKFKKTVFAHDNIMVCIGSDIKSSPTSYRPNDKICTNLFQHIYGTSITPKGLHLNSATPISNTNSETDLSGNNWLISPAGTGYYLPSQGGILHLFKGTHSVPQAHIYPRNSSVTEASYADKMVAQNVAKAWIAHPSGAGNYEYVVVPGTNPSDLVARGEKLGSGKGVYTILQQDAVAHVVNFEKQNLHCYAVFEQTTALPSPVIATSEPCLLIAKPVENNYNISICTPDLKPKINEAVRPKGWLAGVSHISFQIEGLWAIEEPTDKVLVETHTANSTIIRVQLQHGLNKQFNLKPLPTAVEDLQDTKEKKIQVFPNPCKNELFINESYYKNNEWTFVNMSGQVEGTGKMNQDGKIDVSFLKPGLYIINISNAQSGINKSAVFMKE